jgi:hypothetical protein
VSLAFDMTGEEDSFEVIIVISEVAVRLAKRRDDLRHFKAKNSVCVRDTGAVASRVTLVALSRVRPNLDSLAYKWSPISHALHSACHPESTSADAINNRCAGAVIVGPSTHRRRGCQTLRVSRQQEAGHCGRHDCTGGSDKGTASGQNVSHMAVSDRACRCLAETRVSAPPVLIVARFHQNLNWGRPTKQCRCKLQVCMIQKRAFTYEIIGFTFLF